MPIVACFKKSEQFVILCFVNQTRKHLAMDRTLVASGSAEAVVFGGWP